MDLQKMTGPHLLFLDADWSSKEEVIDNLVGALADAGAVESKEDFKQVVYARENHSPTGFERGLAIPHGKSTLVKEAKVAIARLKTPIENWESIDPDNKVDLIFLLAIPAAESGSTHVRLLAQLSAKLMDDDFRARLYAAKTPTSFLSQLDRTEESDKQAAELTPDQGKTDSGRTILAVTACAAGIAHTYMAAEALEKAGHELGITVLVEKQGANGLEDRHTAEQIAAADAVLFAVDTKVKERGRYAGKPYVQVKVAEPLRRAKELLLQAVENPSGTVEKEEVQETVTKAEPKGFKGFLSEMVQAIMTGISYMIPVLVAAGLMLGIAKLTWLYGLGLPIADIGSADYATAGGLKEFLHNLDAFGNLIFKFLYPVFGMFVAYALADRVGIVAGLLGGVFASGMHYTFWGVEGGIPSGFLGALVLGLSAGYIARFLNQKIRLSQNFAAMKPMLIIPGISILLMFILNQYLVDPFFSQLNRWIADIIQGMTGAGELTLSAVIAAATAFDLGGPVNKAAGAIAIGMAADHIFPLTPRVLAIVIPPLGIGLATIIDRFVVGRRVFSPDLRIAGNTSFLLGFLAISEGAIPFMLRNPLLTIPINLIGAIAGSCTAVALGAVQWYPLPAIWGWPLVEHFFAYFVGLAVGVAIIAFSNIFIRYAMIKRAERQGNQII
ncbi:fructose-specific PTS transporter subunit EIIC [Paenibacillus sp. NPDC058910]|uniref:fructose-specific PTS transporter subunit EIIC n=1 Tax=unclassified Paenibacillus TaxID=185978 RepID=UPI0036CEBE26